MNSIKINKNAGNIKRKTANGNEELINENWTAKINFEKQIEDLQLKIEELKRISKTGELAENLTADQNESSAVFRQNTSRSSTNYSNGDPTIHLIISSQIVTLLLKFPVKEFLLKENGIDKPDGENKTEILTADRSRAENIFQRTKSYR